MSRKVQPSEQPSFGNLVQAYRQQRGWTQGELAARWGYTREYVSQIERGKRKLDKAEQVVKLADILDIPSEKLEAIGRGIPKIQGANSEPVALQEADNKLLHAILEQAQTTVKLSWLVWHGNSDKTVYDSLSQLTTNLDEAIANRRGTLLQPAIRLLAYTHEMMGKIAFDKLDYTKAAGHFQEMMTLGEEINETDIIALAMIHNGDLLRRRGRYELAVRCLDASQAYADAANEYTQGMRLQTLARTYAEYGKKSQFLKAIDGAEEIARSVKPSIDTTISQFNLIDVIQERGQGYTLLWEPQKALEIYEKLSKK